MTDAQQIVTQIIAALVRSGVPHMVVGSFARNFHAFARSTQDADIVLAVDAKALDKFVAELGPDFSMDAQATFETNTSTFRYTLIHKEQLPAGANLKSQYDVIVVPHQGGSAKGLVYEQPKASKPLPYRKNETYKSFGMYGESDDIRGGMGLEGVAALAAFVEQGGLLLTLGVSSYLPAEFGITRSIDAQRPRGDFYAPGPIVQTTLVQTTAPTTPPTTHPVLYGYDQKTLPVRWADGPLLTVPEPEPGEPADAASKKIEVLMRFPGGDANVLSGLMRGAEQIRNRPAIVDASVGRGRVLLYAINPIYRWQTFGEHNLVFNALLFYNDMPAR